MALLTINWNPDRRQLRQFGVICLPALPLIAWLWGGGPEVIGGSAAAGLGLALVGLTAPPLLKPVYIGLVVVAAPIGLVVSEATLLLIYFGVFLPIGLVFRVLNRDALRLRSGRSASSYWEPKKQPSAMKSYYRQS